MKKIFRNMYKKSEEIFSGRGLDRYYIIRKGAKFLKSKLKSDFIEIDGHKMFLDSFDSLRLSINGVYEKESTEIVKRIIEKGDIVVDVGANIGYYTLLFAKLVGPNGKVYAFEPEPKNFNILKKNIKINGYNNVKLVQKAVSSITGKTKLYIASDNMGSHSMIKNDQKEIISIDSIRLDDYFHEYKEKIKFIKLDIEGNEMEAIKGMISILKKNSEIKIMTEFNPFMLQKSGIEPKKYLEFLKEFDFKIYFPDKKTSKIIPVNIDEFPKKYTPKKRINVNLICASKPLII